MDKQAGVRLRAWLEAGPPTPAELAREAGCSREFVWRVLRVSACERLGVPVEAIFGPKEVDRDAAVA